MAKKKQSKYYVVWEGVEIGIFSSWDECKKNIQAYPQAKYKSYKTQEEAEVAFAQGYYNAIKEAKKEKELSSKTNGITPKGMQQAQLPALCVDAACSGNPGTMEYRGVWVNEDGSNYEVFRQGPYANGTNNIGEFLALVHGLAFLDKEQCPVHIYSDSRTAMSWVRKKMCRTKLAQDSRNAKLFEIIQRAELWLKNNTIHRDILKWDTEEWGEIPADFGRK